MSRFIPGMVPPADLDDALFLVVRDGAVLLDAGEILVRSPEALGLSPSGRIFLGTYDGAPVFAASVDAADPRFVPLRGAIALAGDDRFDLIATAAELDHFERTHKFCGRCSTALIALAGERAKTCPSCSLHVYPRVHPAVIVLVHRGDEILLAHRPKAPFFALVAGFVESGETFEQCVAREVREEVGLEVGDIRYFGSQPWPFPHQVMVGFFARYEGGAIVVDGKELDEAHFFARDALPTLPPPTSIARKLIDAWLDGSARVR